MDIVEKSLNKYGRSVYLTDGEWTSAVFGALVEPLRYKNKMYMSGDFTEIGHFDEGYYLYIGPVSHNPKNLSQNALVHTSDGISYKFHRCETVFSADKPVYVWAVIKEKV